MKHTISLLGILLGILCGCTSGDFDASKAGEIQFAHTTVSNGTPIGYEWIIPADEVQSILKHIVAHDPKYDAALVSGGQTASLSYAGGEIKVAWCRVKMADTVVLLTIRGSRYMLVEPHAGEFYEMLEKHKKRSSQPQD
jgi:hypothetical protein